ncbi:MAG: hypothetical protein V4666_07430 [Bacteroidota bacterium]
MNKYLKILINVIILIVLIITIKIISIESNYVDCNPFNKEHLEWLPYKKNEVLIFRFKNKIKKYIITEYEINHNDSYNKKFSEGCCEEGVRTILQSNNDTIRIELLNYENQLSASGPELYINDNVFYPDRVKLKKGEKLDSMVVRKNYKIKRNKGLVEFSKNDTIWKLKTTN